MDPQGSGRGRVEEMSDELSTERARLLRGTALWMVLTVVFWILVVLTIWVATHEDDQAPDQTARKTYSRPSAGGLGVTESNSPAPLGVAASGIYFPRDNAFAPESRVSPRAAFFIFSQRGAAASSYNLSGRTDNSRFRPVPLFIGRVPFVRAKSDAGEGVTQSCRPELACGLISAIRG